MNNCSICLSHFILCYLSSHKGIIFFLSNCVWPQSLIAYANQSLFHVSTISVIYHSLAFLAPFWYHCMHLYTFQVYVSFNYVLYFPHSSVIYIYLTVCTIIFCVLSTCYFTAEPMLCCNSVSHLRKTCLITASDQLICIATVFVHQSEIIVITFCMQKMISDDDYNGWTCSHMSNMW